MRSLVVAAALVGGLVGCQSVYQAPVVEPVPVGRYQLSTAEAEAVRATVARALKDPYSAKFGEPILASQDRRSGIVYVCGTVNAKNSFGAYTGDEWFMGALSPRTGGFALVEFGTSPDERVRKLAMCNQYVAIAWT